MRISHGESRLTVNPKGGAIGELYLGGQSVLRDQPGVHFQASLLFPFPNRLKEGTFEFQSKKFQFEHNDFGRPNALHGIIHDKEFTLSQVNENELHASLDFSGNSDSYPFPFQFQVRYQLADKGLRMEHTIINTGSEDMPAGYGWHPYFDVQDYEAIELKLPNALQVEVDAHMIPTRRKMPFHLFDDFQAVKSHQLDTCFALQDADDGAVTYLKFGNGTIIEIWQDENFPFLQVFTPDDRASIAIEPMTCNINALNNGEGLKLLKPGEVWRFNCGVKLN